jgi:replication factor A2
MKFANYLQGSRDRQSLIPFTAKQLIGASQDPSGDLLKIDGTDVHTVKIMGIVEMVEEHATNITYRVNDGTGVIECKLWVEKDGGASKHQTCGQFSYVQVVGSLKTYEGVNHILVYKCTPVEDFNEMTHHFLGE